MLSKEQQNDNMYNTEDDDKGCKVDINTEE